MKKKIICCMLTFLTSISLLTGCKIGDTEYVLDTHIINSHTILSINDKNCNIKEAMIYFCNYRNLYGSAYDVDLWEYDFGESSLVDYVKDVTIDEVTRVYCMDLLAKEKNIELTSEEKDKAEEAGEEYFKSLNENEIRYMDVSEKDIIKTYKNYALAEKLYYSLTQGVEAEVSDDDARVMKAQQIFVSSESTANSVKKKIKNGEDFAAISATVNEVEDFDVNVTRGAYPKKVEDIAFELDDEEISGAIKVDNGYYFIKCISKIDKKLTESNKVNILIAREKEQFDDGYLDFVENAKFEFNDSLWKDLDTKTAKEVKTKSFFDIYKKHFK